MRTPRPGCLALFVFVAGSLDAASLEDRVEALFRPLLGETMALSPGGDRLAYTVRTAAELSVVMVDLENPVIRQRVRAEPDPDPLVPAGDPPPLRYLRWATPHRLVFAPVPRVVPLPPVAGPDGQPQPNPDGPAILAPILAVDADGRQRGTLVDAKRFQETPAEARRTLADLLRTTNELQAARAEAVRWRMPQVDILGFLPHDREQLIIATHGAYSVPMQHLLDVRTGSVREFGGDWPVPPGAPKIFDEYRLKVVGERLRSPRPQTSWHDVELARIQEDLDRKFPGRTVEIVDWNETRTRVLTRVTGGRDPGRIFLFQRPEDLVVELFRRAPWLTSVQLHDTRYFAPPADRGGLAGYVTLPAHSVSAPPLLLAFPAAGETPPDGFDPEAQVFAELGFAVVRLLGRAVGPDAPSAPSIDEARTTLSWLAAQPWAEFDADRVAVLGHDPGTAAAVQGLLGASGPFRAGILLGSADPIGGEGPEEPAGTRPPVLWLRPRSGSAPTLPTAGGREQPARFGTSGEIAELPPGFAEGVPGARAAAYRRMATFLQQHLGTRGPAAEREEVQE